MKKMKFYIKNNIEYFDFMWVTVGKDESIYMGFSFKGVGKIKKICEGQSDLYPNKEFATEDSADSKISFHSSGLYKIEPKIKKTREDRATVLGEELSSIDDPRIMLEIFFPINMVKSEKLPNSRDQIIDITGMREDFPNKQLRCTVLCIDSQKGRALLEASEGCLIHTSLVETRYAFEVNEKIWLWLVRIHEADCESGLNEYTYFLSGKGIHWR